MNKKVKRIVIDDKEDLRIYKAAYRNSSRTTLIISLCITFIVILFISSYFVFSYYKLVDIGKLLNTNNNVNTNIGEVYIINAPTIEEVINNKSFVNLSDDIIYDSIGVVEYKNGDDNISSYNLKYNILENDFIDANNYKASKVFVKFWYSSDSTNWKYLTNVITYNGDTISPSVNGYYNISNVKGLLNILTNKEIKSGDKVYWKAETRIKNSQGLVKNKKIKVSFKIQ